MTDHDDPLDDRASALLDGEGDPPDPTDRELLVRIERLAAARDTLRRTDAPIDPLRREHAITAALEAFDEEPPGVDAAATPLRPRWRRRIRAIELAGIAAAIALLALAVPLLGRLDPGSHEDVVAPDARTEAAPGGAASGDPAPTEMALGSAGALSSDLGTFSDLGPLADAVRVRLAATTTTARGASSVDSSGAASTAPTCADQRAAGGPEIFTAPATLGGRPVLVVVRADPDGGRTLVVLAVDDCSAVSTQRL